MTDFGATEISRCLWLNVVFGEAYNINTLQVRYHSIGIHFILFHVEFKDGLSILVLKNGATRYKNLQLEIAKGLEKKVKCVERPPARCISHSAVFIRLFISELYEDWECSKE
jgi:hypothetical protein